MPLFKLVTECVFEEVYVIDAETYEEAIVKLDSSDFLQKHISNEVKSWTQLIDSDMSTELNRIRDEGYF